MATNPLAGLGINLAQTHNAYAIENAVEEYLDLADRVKEIELRMDSIKREIMATMQSSGMTKFECQISTGGIGKVIIVQPTERTTYPKADLDAIAKNDARLQKILDGIAKRTTVNAYVKIAR